MKLLQLISSVAFLAGFALLFPYFSHPKDSEFAEKADVQPLVASRRERKMRIGLVLVFSTFIVDVIQFYQTYFGS